MRLTALRVRCAAGGSRPLAALGEYLDSENLELRAAALACLVEQVREDELPRIRALIERMLSQGTGADRASIAEILGARRSRRPRSVAGTSLEDDDITVRCAALRSAGHAGLLEHVPALIRALGAAETEAAARAGLIALGDRALDRLSDSLVDEQVPIEVRRAIPGC